MGKIADIDTEPRNEKSSNAKQGKMQDDKRSAKPGDRTVPFKEDGSDLSL